MKYFRIFIYIISITILTIVTQVGGIFYLIALLLKPLVFKKLKLRSRLLVFPILFLIVYFLGSFLFVPTIAKSLGRVPLPIFSNEKIKPLNIMTCILNRHYVKNKLKENIENVTVKMNNKHPNSVISYLDANFPFYNGFPLLPHLSHDDGKKLDIAFFYKNKKGVELNRKTPSFMGYGVFEEPKKGEFNMPKKCEKKGYWQYSILEKFVPQWNKEKILFDKKRTKSMIQFLLQEKTTQKILIEPHLKTRMKLHHKKVRFHGCHAVRHDDHIHLQIR